MIAFDVHGTPTPKGSMRGFYNRKRRRVIVTTGGSAVNEAKLRSWDVRVQDAARAAVGEGARMPFEARALMVSIEFRMERPRKHWGRGKNVTRLLPSATARPVNKPDVDKLARATLDSLTGIVFDDDSRIVRLAVEKIWAELGNDGASILIDEVA